MSIGVTYYSILGVPETASSQEIRRAYHQQLRRWSPEGGGLDAAALADNDSSRLPRYLGGINSAEEKRDSEIIAILYAIYRILRDPNSRTLYDAQLLQQRQAAAAAEASEWAAWWWGGGVNASSTSSSPWAFLTPALPAALGISSPSITVHVTATPSGHHHHTAYRPEALPSRSDAESKIMTPPRPSLLTAPALMDRMEAAFWLSPKSPEATKDKEDDAGGRDKKHWKVSRRCEVIVQQLTPV